MLVDAHVHLLPDRLAAAIRRFFEERLPDYARYPHTHAAARDALAQAGVPATDAALALLRTARSVQADLTPVGPRLVPLSRPQLAGLEDRLLFGSDAPNTGVTVEAAVAHVRALGLEPAAERAILGETAERLLAR